MVLFGLSHGPTRQVVNGDGSGEGEGEGELNGWRGRAETIVLLRSKVGAFLPPQPHVTDVQKGGREDVRVLDAPTV